MLVMVVQYAVTVCPLAMGDLQERGEQAEAQWLDEDQGDCRDW